jgi:hypothetical protein
MSLHFLFIQFEFTHAVGPHAGRYVVEPRILPDASATPLPADVGGRGGVAQMKPRLDARNQQLAGTSRGVGGSDVLVIGVVGAPAGQRRLLRRARQIESGTPPAEVPLSLVTLVKGTQPLASKSAATSRLETLRFSESEQRRWVEDGLRVLNLAIRGYRAGAPDPYALEVTRRDARRTRIGFGTTEDVQNGLWREAVELAPELQPRPKRIERLRPSEAVASVLSGKSEVLEAEDLLLRALVDLDQRRTRGAAFGVAGAMRLLASELSSGPEAVGLDLESLAPRAQTAEQLASAAAAGPLDSVQVQELEAVIDAVQELLGAWRYQRTE